MGFFDIFRRKEPQVAMQAQPVAIPPNARAERNAQRIARLQAAIAAGDTRPELEAELARRKGGR